MAAADRGTLYNLPLTGPVKWNHNQEAALVQGQSPFSHSAASLSDQARELYLQYLWLPETLMPISQFLPLLQLLVRDAPSSSTAEAIHPLHAAIDDIMVTGKWCSYKYQVMLPTMLAAGEVPDSETKMMSFVYARIASDAQETQPGTSLDQASAQKKFLSSIEKREVQIQILLHLLKLSLPGHCPPPTIRHVPLPPAQKGRKLHHRAHSSSEDEASLTPHAILEDRVEGLMDRLGLWQMAIDDTGRDDAADKSVKQLRDWTQVFCDDIVQPLFADKLPSLYRLLRMKLFRIPQWSSEEDEPNEAEHPGSTPIPDESESVPQRARSQSLSRSRSRSISVSLTQEAEARRGGSKKRVLQREVSMSKAFKKSKRKEPELREPARGSATPVPVSLSAAPNPKVLVAGTPMKPKGRAFAGRVASTVLVSDTPVKAKPRASAVASEDEGAQSDESF
ncbi:hypothetical protein FA95DRAFT_1560179 [Auriscalpium vulgare]|uniref:Uncharacterized protein n=1 Tax=Auriscalpium vulgare TaxID=40419 RepID=A0ACB8RQ79_9AGAM|nr:hypothetical protein FA95DRAFT_1560179 [Auriscalpium vulgare]